MTKNNKRIITGLVGVSVLLAAIPPMPLYAAANLYNIGNTQQKAKTDLTVDQAVKRAIQHSSDLKAMNESQYLNELERDDIIDNLNAVENQTEAQRINYFVQLLQNELSHSLYDTNEDVQKGKIELSVMQFFTSIINAEKNLELKEEALKLSKKNLDIQKVKLDLGLLSQSAYDTAVYQYEKEKAEIADVEASLNSAYRSLNSIMGEDLNNRYSLQLNFSYEPLGAVQLESYINTAIVNSPSVKSLENTIQVNQYKVDTYVDDYTGADGSYSKESLIVSVNQSKRSLSELKDNIRSTLTSAYETMESLERAYETNVMQYEEMEKQLAIKETQLSLGTITELEVEQHRYDMLSLQYTMENQINNHAVKKHEFNNPQLITSASGSGASME